MKIIRKGQLPDEIEYHWECNLCGTEWTAPRKEAQECINDRDGAAIGMNCPTCKQKAYTRMHRPKPVK